MSDSDIGAAARAGKRKKPTGSRSDAGPLRKTTAAANTSKPKGKKQRTDGLRRQPETDSEIEELVVEEIESDNEAEGVDVDEPQRPTARGRQKKPAPNASGKPVNSTAPPSKGKGRAAAPPAKKQGALAKATEVVDVDDNEEGDEMQVDHAQDLAAAYNRANGVSIDKDRKGPGVRQQSRAGQESKLAKENARLKEELERNKGHLADLKAKFDEMINIRETEAEALMNVESTQFHAQLHAQKVLIADLHAQLAKKEPLLRSSSGKKAVVALLTREEADEEVKGYKNQLSAATHSLNEARRTIAAKDTEILELEQANKDLKVELDAEIARSKALSDKPTKVPENGFTIASEDPKAAKILRLYEDLTNVLVSNIKFVENNYGGKDWVFNCVYTHADPLKSETENIACPALNFLLRICHEPPANQEYRPGMQLVEAIHFQPLELDKETPEFAEKLGFLKSTFSFDRNQLALLIKTLSEALNESEEDDADDDDDIGMDS